MQLQGPTTSRKLSNACHQSKRHRTSPFRLGNLDTEFASLQHSRHKVRRSQATFKNCQSAWRRSAFGLKSFPAHRPEAGCRLELVESGLRR